MLSDQQNGTFRRMQRGGYGNNMLGPMLQQGQFARTAPNVKRLNANRGVNSLSARGFAPGSGFGEVGSARTPTGVGSPAGLAALFGDGYGDVSTPTPGQVAPSFGGAAPPPQLLGGNQPTMGFGGPPAPPQPFGAPAPGEQTPGQQQPISPLLAQLGMLMMAQQGKGGAR